ncbi:MAG: hypothetical protein ACR2NI_03905, partial [Pirellulales bacterium]
MASITIGLPELAGQSGLTLSILKPSNRGVIESGLSLSETESGVFTATSVDNLSGLIYMFQVRNSGGEIVDLFTYRANFGNIGVFSGDGPEVANYLGVWDANTNTPELANEYEGVAGDFYFVSNGGNTALGSSSTWAAGDRIIWNGTGWQKIKKAVQVDANSRMVCLNTETSLFADGEHPVRDPDGRAGWRYTNTTGNKINWYLWSEVQHQDYSLSQFDGIYMVIEIKTQGSMPYWTVYTKPQGDGNDASWFRSRINYSDEAASAALQAGRYLFHSSNLDVTGIEPSLQRVSLPVGFNTVGLQGADEELWLMALSTSSNYPAGTNDFLVEKVGVQINNSIQGIELAAVDTRPVYTDYFLGSYAAEADYPESGSQGQWIINSTDDTMLVWDTEGGSWAATGSTAEAPASAVADYPFQYVYSSLDGSGYGFMNAYPTDGWSNTPDGKIQSTAGGGNILGSRIKFATLKNIGDEVTIQASDNNGAYNRYCIIGLEAGVDADAMSWKVAGQPASGTTWMLNDSEDRNKVELYSAYIEPYWGGTTYGHNLVNARNSSGLAGMFSNQGEKQITFRVGSDYRIEMYIDGHYFVRTNNVPTIGVDLYVSTYGNTGRIFDQPTGNGANYLGGTAPNATGARYFMSTVGTPAGATELENNGTNYLYSDTEAGDAGDIELSDTEASAARFCRVFKDFTGLTLKERADWMHPVVEADRTALNEVEHLVTGYYHSLDLTLAEIQAKMSMWADGLTAAKAGSVELTLALTQSLLAPTASTSGTVAFTPNYTFDGTHTHTASENYHAGDTFYDTYGIEEISFTGSFVTIHFRDSASITSWRSTAQTITLACSSGAYTWEDTHTLDQAAEYSVSSYNYIHYQPSTLDSAERGELSELLAVNGTGSSILDVTFNGSGQSVAVALSET